MAAPRRSIGDLMRTLQSSIDAFEQHRISNNLPAPSLVANSPALPPLPPKLLASTNAALDATRELEALLLGPTQYLFRLLSPACMIISVLHATCVLGIAESLGPDESASFDVLAERCNGQANANEVRQLLRMAMSFYIFEEPEKDLVKHTNASLLLRQPMYKEWVGFASEEFSYPAAKLVSSMQKWPRSEDINESAFALANGGRGLYEELRQNSTRRQRFTNTMASLQSRPTHALRHLYNDLEWTSDTAPSLLVDLGGADGTVAIGLLEQFPKLKVVVQDLPDVIAARKTPTDPEIAQRLSFRTHDFFTPQPDSGADAYLIRSTLHNWPDKQAKSIFEALVPALRKGTRVILQETCLREPGEYPTRYEEQVLRGYDLSMKTTFNSRHRDLSAFQSLLHEASPHYKFVRTKASEGSAFRVIEFVWDGSS